MRSNTDYFFANMARLVTGSTIATVISILSLPVLTRLFDTSVFGLYAMFTSLASIIGVLVCLRYEPTVVLPDVDRDAVVQWLICLVFACLFAVVLAGGLFSTGAIGLIGTQTDWPLLLIYLLPVYLLIHGVNLAESAWHNRFSNYRSLAVASVIYQAFLAIAAIVAALFGFNSAATLVLAFIGARAIAALFLSTQATPIRRRSILTSLDRRAVVHGIVRYRRFPLFGLWSALLSMASWQLPVLLLGVFFSPAIAGLYLLGFRVLQVPMKLVGNAMNKVFLQQGSRANRDGNLARLVEGLFVEIVKATLVPLAIVAMVAPDLYALVFGAEWREAGRYTQILAPWAILWFLTGPFTGLFSILDKQPLQLYWNILNFGLRLAAIVTGAATGDALLTIALLSIAGVITYSIKLLLTFRLVQLRPRQALAASLRYLVIALVAVVMLVVIHLIVESQVLLLSLALGIIAAYLALTYWQYILTLTEQAFGESNQDRKS